MTTIFNEPSEQEEIFINGIYGLDNLGNTCYLNSIIQSLANLTHFRKFLLDKEFVDHLLYKLNSSNSDLKTNLHTVYNSPLYQFYRIIKTIWTGSIDSESLKPTTLRKKIGSKNSMFKTSQQQDAHEAFSILIEMMHMEIAQKVTIRNLSLEPSPLDTACINFWYKEYSPLYNIFHSMFMNSRVCSSCAHSSETYEPNLFLGLDIPKPGTKSKFCESMLENTNPFILSNYINIVCKIPSIQISGSTKQAMCELLDPQIIEQIKEKHLLITDINSKYDLLDCIDDFISPKQIDNFQCGNCGNKCSCLSSTRMVIAPKTLCIHIKRFSSFLTKRSNLITFPENIDISQILLNSSQTNTKYKLKAIINHSGSNLNFGHYYTYAYSNIHEKWFNFNDENVIEIDKKFLCTPNAYLLFYEQDD
jgi:ubiquitin C-terminal hydrolase